MSEDIVLPAGVNPSALFLVWQALGGNCAHVAKAYGLRECYVKAMEHDFQWRDLAGGAFQLGDKKLEREINRAQNFAQAVRMRRILESAMEHLEKNPHLLQNTLSSSDEQGNTVINAKPLVELAKACESVQNSTYRALGDKIAVTADSIEGDPERIRSLSVMVYNAVNRAATNVDKILEPAQVVELHEKELRIAHAATSET